VSEWDVFMRLALIFAWACCFPTLASVQVLVVQPVLNQITGDSLFVAVTVNSTFELASVTASVGGSSVPLGFSQTAVPVRFGATPGWTNSVSLEGLERGAYSLSVTAKDAFGAEASAQTSFRLDRKPVLQVTAPAQGSVIKGVVPVEFSFSDDGEAPASVRILAGATVLATNRLGALNLSAYDHSSVALRFEIKDSEGQITAEERTVFVESNPRLRLIGAAPPPVDPKTKIQGDWIAYHDGGIWAGLSNMVTHLAYGIQSDGHRTLALAQDGTLYTDPVRYYSRERGWFYAVMKLKDGVVTPVMDEVKGRKIETEFISNSDPYWDGEHIFYTKRDPLRGYALIKLADGVETIIAGWNDYAPVYTALEGWVAYIQKGTTGQDQIWVRSPDGDRIQRTFFGSSSKIEMLNPKGELILNNGGVKYLSQPGRQLLELGRFIGQSAWSADHWAVTIGSTLFALHLGDLIQSIAIRSGQVEISVQTASTGPVELQASTDLVNWTTLATVVPAGGVAEFKVPGSAGQGVKFYRTIGR
jgi:hypothetical protein